MSEETVKEYFFENVNDLIKMIYASNQNISVIRLQKALYFLFAYYGATYGSLESDSGNGENLTEVDKKYPKYLFDEQFEAWRYGPVIKRIYAAEKNGEYDEYGKDSELEGADYDRDVLKFLDEVLVQINDMSDFALVNRSHQDEAWKSKFVEGTKFIKMNRDAIIEEYKKNYE